jgi:uroporphyrinogen-III synthase
MASETAALVKRLGGEPVSAPALREEPLPAEPAVAAFLDRLEAGEIAFVVLLTGVGVSALFETARSLGREEALKEGLGKARTVCRGPKPTSALAARGLKPVFSLPSPYTTHELLSVIDGLPVEGTAVAVVHYGERSEPLTKALGLRAARVHELVLYEWRLPEDTQPLVRLAEETLAGRLDAVVFTTQVQARHLFAVVDASLREPLAQALSGPVLCAAVGPTCAQALKALGVSNVLVPEVPKLGPLFTALASRLAERKGALSEAPEV